MDVADCMNFMLCHYANFSHNTTLFNVQPFRQTTVRDTVRRQVKFSYKLYDTLIVVFFLQFFTECFQQ